ncbi:hypothetical protein [Zobellella sp. An-6]|uniref:hypothetical protein n=1 Tax=Zobellella sp. An-6 TaxID=3400218 RepID=UPI0040422B72
MKKLNTATASWQGGPQLGGMQLMPFAQISARRYLEYLESEERLQIRLHYGSRGRPERIYHKSGQG